MRRPALVSALAAAFGLLEAVEAGPVYERQATSTAASTTSVASVASTTLSASASSTTVASSTGTAGSVSGTTSGTAAAATSLAVWLSNDPNGDPKTITPYITTINGVATTIDAAPLSFSNAASPTSSGIPMPTGNGFAQCHDLSGPYRPFCQPNNGSDVYPGATNYVTWNANAFLSENTTIKILLNYATPHETDGEQAWHSDPTLNQYGYVSITYQNDWLKGQPRNNLTFVLLAADPGAPLQFHPGPTVSLTQKPKEHHKPSPTQKPSKLGLEVGLPVMGAVIILILFVVFFGMKGHRRFEIKKRAGYGVGQSRRQRMKRGKKAGPIMLDDDDVAGGRARGVEGGFRDEPVRGAEDIEMGDRPARGRQQHQAHVRDDSLGSLADSPTRDGRGQYGGGNAFRDEVERQRTGGGANRF